MHEEHYGDHAIDHCAACGGMWFDRGEIESFLQDRGTRKTAPGALASVPDAQGACPRCTGETLELIVFRGVEVQSCPKCSGLFLGRSSLQLILDKTRESAGYSAGDLAVDVASGMPDLPLAIIEGIFEFLGDLLSDL